MEVRWLTEVPGRAAVSVLSVDADSGSVYIADGWGVAYAALRLRRLSLADGRELATARLGNQARCMAQFDGALVAATDTKLFRLDPRSLEEIAPRWDRRVPRYTDMLGRAGDRLVLANWKHDSCAVVDIDAWRVRRVRPGPYPVLVAAREQLYVFSRSTGRLSRLDADDQRVRLESVANGPPAADIAYDEQEAAFWILEGVPAVEMRTDRSVRVRPGPPSDVVRRLRAAGGGEHRLRLDRPARQIALDAHRRRLWTVDAASSISVYDLSDLALVVRHELPDDARIVSFAPSAGVVLTATGVLSTPTTRLACLVTHAA